MVFLVLAVMYEPESLGSHSPRLIELLSLLNVQNPTRTLLSYILQRLNLCGGEGWVAGRRALVKKCLHLGEVNRKISSIPEGGAGTLRITHAPDPRSKCMSKTDSLSEQRLPPFSTPSHTYTHTHTNTPTHPP